VDDAGVQRRLALTPIATANPRLLPQITPEPPSIHMAARPRSISD
jgi:hypothetical protein